MPKLPKRSPLDVYAELEVTFKTTCFRLHSTGSSLILQFENLWDSNRLLSQLKNLSICDRTFISEVDRFLNDADLTLCLFNERFPVLGAGANPFLQRMLTIAVR